MNNRLRAGMLGAVLLAGLLSACVPGRENRLVEGSLTVGGSTSLEMVATGLLEAFTADTGVPAAYTPGSSREGLIGALAGNLDFAFSSCLPGEEGIEAMVFAYAPLCIVVNSQNPVEELSLQQLGDIAAGRVSNWAQLGGEDMPIAFLGRQLGSGARQVFEEALSLEGMCAYAAVYEGAASLMTAVERNPGAIGYASSLQCDEATRVLAIDGTRPTEEELRGRVYPFVQTFCLLYREDQPADEAERLFLRYMQHANIEILAGQAVFVNVPDYVRGTPGLHGGAPPPHTQGERNGQAT